MSLIGLIINCLLGVSVTTVAQAERAQADGADYLGVGAMFVTHSDQTGCFICFSTKHWKQYAKH